MVSSGVILDTAAPAGPSRRRVTADRLAALIAAAGTRTTPASTFAARLVLHGALSADASREETGSSRHAGWIVARDVEENLERTATSVVAQTAAVTDGAALAEVRLEVMRGLRRQVQIDRRAAAAVAESVVDGLVERGDLVRDGGRLRLRGQPTRSLDPATAEAMDRLVAALDRADPPPLSEAAREAGCPPDAIRLVEAEGRIVRLDDDLAYAATAFDALRDRALGLAVTGPVSPAAFRDASGTSRKYVMAVLEELDRRGIMARTPAGHVRGPRAPR